MHTVWFAKKMKLWTNVEACSRKSAEVTIIILSYVHQGASVKMAML